MSERHDAPRRAPDRFVPAEGVVHAFRAFIVAATVAIFTLASTHAAPEAPAKDGSKVASAEVPADPAVVE